MILTLGGIKGGSGKTTLATNLAVNRASLGKRVLLVDADEQHSASIWSEQRAASNTNTLLTTISLTGKSVNIQTLKMVNDYDDIIIDTGGRDTTSQRAALTISDVFLTPFHPRSLDVWTLGHVSSLINEIQAVNAKLTSYAVINHADSQGSDNDSAGEIIKNHSDIIKFLQVKIGQRKAFGNAATEGLGVIELKSKDKKAIKEIKDLEEMIYGS